MGNAGNSDIKLQALFPPVVGTGPYWNARCCIDKDAAILSSVPKCNVFFFWRDEKVCSIPISILGNQEGCIQMNLYVHSAIVSIDLKNN